MKLPFYTKDIKAIEVLRHKTPEGTFVLRAIPSWPCYDKDGAGKVMSVELELSLETGHGSFVIEEQGYE